MIYMIKENGKRELEAQTSRMTHTMICAKSRASQRSREQQQQKLICQCWPCSRQNSLCWWPDTPTSGQREQHLYVLSVVTSFFMSGSKKFQISVNDKEPIPVCDGIPFFFFFLLKIFLQIQDQLELEKTQICWGRQRRCYSHQNTV